MSYKYRGKIYNDLEIREQNGIILTNNNTQIKHTGTGDLDIYSNGNINIGSTGNNIITIGSSNNLTYINGILINSIILESTDYLTEGISNLYFTNKRAIDGVSGHINTANVIENPNYLYFTNQRAIDGVSGHINTANVIENPNYLYFTNQRAIDGVSGHINSDNIIEGLSNLYFTNQRAIDGVSGHINTANVVENPNYLYFTSQRAVDALVANNGIVIPSNDITLQSTTKSVLIYGGETAVMDAIKLNAPNGGIDISGGASGININTTGTLNIGTTGNINVTTAVGATINFHSNLLINGSETVGNSDGITNYIFLKNSTDNTKHWRIYVDNAGSLNFDRFNGTSWINKSSFS